MLQSLSYSFCWHGPAAVPHKAGKLWPNFQGNWEECLIQKAHATKDKQANPRPNSQPEAEIVWRYTYKEAEFPHTSKKFS